MASGRSMASPRAQRLAVMVVMSAVFALTMGLAYLTAAVSEAPAADGLEAPRTLELEGLRLTVPGAWDEDDRALRQLGIEQGTLLRDPERPERWMLVTTTASSRPVSPPEQLTRFVAALLGPELEPMLEPMMPQRGTRRGELVTLEYVGLTPAPQAPGRRLHLFETLTVDGTRHWLIYLTDRVEPGASMPAALERNLSLLRRVGHSAALDR